MRELDSESSPKLAYRPSKIFMNIGIHPAHVVNISLARFALLYDYDRLSYLVC